MNSNNKPVSPINMHPTPNNTPTQFNTPTTQIKDSGERREFSSGAVRDITTGKGRFDLMPLNIIANISTLQSDYKAILNCLHNFTLTNSVKYLYDALTIFNPTYNHLLLLAIHYENGALKYGEYNWQKGIPVSSYVDSAARHLTKHYANQTDEPHDIAFLWNIVSCIWTAENCPD